MRRLDERDIYPADSAFTGGVGWTEGLDAEDLTGVLRSALHEEYADASDEEMSDALANMLDSISPAEAVSFASALNQIGKGASQLISDPAFAAVAQVALPVLGGAAGTMIGGPVGAALGGKLGSLAASALPTRPAPAQATARPVAAVPAPTAAVASPAGIMAPAAVVAAAPAPSAPAIIPPGIPPPVPGSQPDVLRSLLATALGQHGTQTVSGVPVAQVLGLLSQVFGKAAADADELMYLDQQSDAAESVLDATGDSAGWLYADLIGADNLELAEATGWDWLDR